MSAAKGRLSVDTAEVTSRISRANYGFLVANPWDDSIHGEDDPKYWDPMVCCYYATNQMRWFLKKVGVLRLLPK